MLNRWTGLALALLIGACGGGGGYTPDGHVAVADAGMLPDGGGRPDSGGGGPDAARNPADGGPDGAPADAPPPVLSLTGVDPGAASRTQDTTLVVSGFDIAPGASIVLSNCDTGTTYDLSAGATVSSDGLSISTSLAADPAREQ